MEQPQGDARAVAQAAAVAAVLDFLECINRRDADRLAELMTDDYEFVDSLGQAVRGREAMRAGWHAYFRLCPDYRVTREEVFSDGDKVAVFGTAGGTIAAAGQLPSENRWQAAAAWLAQVQDGRIRRWRVYADNKPVYDILARSR